MNWSQFFKRSNSAPVARERLQILLAHERSPLGRSDLIAVLKEEILAAITRHVEVESDKVQVKMDRGAAVSTLEIEVEIPNMATALAANS
jgi:cell division topological specificity factor